MSRHNTIGLVLPMLFCALIQTSPSLAQEGAFVDGNPVMMLEDITGSLLADDPAATNTEPSPPSTEDPAIPVDGGLSLLLAAGAAYGVRAVRGKNEKR